MKKLLSIIFLLLVTTTQSFAAIEKVYNEKGERIGSVRKNGDTYEWFDMNDRKVESYKDLSNGGEIFVGSPGSRFNYPAYDPYHYYVTTPYYFYTPPVIHPVRPPHIHPVNPASGGVQVIKTGHSYYN